MNPLRIEKLSLYQASSASSVAVNISFTNCEVNGLLGWDLSSVKANWDEGTLNGVVSFSDQVIFDADYEVNGKVILVPVKGKGKAHITFDEMVSDIELKGKTMSKKGKKYFSVDSFKVNMRPKAAKFHFTDPLRGNTPLGESINRALTENWREIMEDVKGPIGEGLGAAFKQTANRVFSKIPLDVLVPN